MGGIARQNQMKAIEIGGVADHRVNLSRPSGTCAHRPSGPNVETLGYYRQSLRDKDLPAFCECQWIKSYWHWTFLSALALTGPGKRTRMSALQSLAALHRKNIRCAL